MKRFIATIIAFVYVVSGITVPAIADEGVLPETTILEAEFDASGSSLIGGTYTTSGAVTERGLTLLGGDQYWNENDQKNLWRTRIAYANAEFTVDEEKEVLVDTEVRQQIYLKVIYSGVSGGWFFVRYTNQSGGTVETEKVSVSETGAEGGGEYVFKLTDFDWNSDLSVADFAICTTTYTEDKLYHANASPNYSTKEVYIKSVQLHILSEVTVFDAEFDATGGSLNGGTYTTSGAVTESGLTLLGGDKYWNESHNMNLWRSRIAYANAAFTIEESKKR